MNIAKVTFPLYKIRSYINIDNDLLDRVIITTIKGKYILDDYSYNGTFEERRLKVAINYPDKLYKLKEKILYLRQLVKYKSGTTFVDLNGNILKYKKSSDLFNITSHKIIKKTPKDNWTVLKLNNIEQSILVGETVLSEIKYASMMRTKWGLFLYDLTSIQHDPYKRKI